MPDTATRACPLRDLELPLDKILTLTKYVCMSDKLKIKKSLPISLENWKRPRFLEALPSKSATANAIDGKQKGLGY